MRMNEYHMTRRVLIAVVSGGRLGWMDGVKVALGSRGMTVLALRKIIRSGESWSICR